MAQVAYPASDLQDKFLIEGVSVALTKSGKEYANLKLIKGKEKLDGKIWDWTASMANTIQTGNVIKAVYRQDSYQGKIQINVIHFTKIEGDLSSFMRTACTGSPEELWKKAVAIVSEMEDPFVRFVSEELLVHPLIVDKIKTAPAAITVHSNWVSGLLEHGLSMAKLAKPVHENYLQWAPELSLSKILFGCLFHDVCKCIEYETKGAAYKSSTLGELVNHIVFGPALVWEIAKRYKEPISDLEVGELMHIIASHHGKADFGSPVPPKTLEALLVHHIDILDGSFMHAWDTIRSGSEEPGSPMTKQSFFHKARYLIQEINDEPFGKDEPSGDGGELDDGSPW